MELGSFCYPLVIFSVNYFQELRVIVKFCVLSSYTDNSNKPTIKEVPANDVSMEPKNSALTTQHVFSMPSNVAYQSTCVGTTLDRIESRDAFLNLKCRVSSSRFVQRLVEFVTCHW